MRPEIIRVGGGLCSVVVKDLRLKYEDKGKESSFKDKDKDLMSKDEDLKIGSQGSLRTRTFLEDNNTAVRQYGEVDMNLNLTSAQWQISHPFVRHSVTARRWRLIFHMLR